MENLKWSAGFVTVDCTLSLGIDWIRMLLLFAGSVGAIGVAGLRKGEGTGAHRRAVMALFVLLVGVCPASGK